MRSTPRALAAARSRDAPWRGNWRGARDAAYSAPLRPSCARWRRSRRPVSPPANEPKNIRSRPSSEWTRRRNWDRRTEPGRAQPQIRAFAAAITFLTRFRSGALVAHDLDDLPASSVYFPVVGLVVGVAGAAVVAFSAIVVAGRARRSILSIAFTVWITGAFHEDALADSLDGFGGGWDKAQVLAIMKDSRVGSYALVGVLLVLAAKIAALTAVFDRDMAQRSLVASGILGVGRALIAAHVLGRWSSVVLIATHEYVRPPTSAERSGAGRPFVGAITGTRLGAATAIALVIATAAVGRSALIVVAVIAPA